MLSAMAASAMELAINQALTLVLDQYQDEGSRERLQALNGKVVAIDLQGPGNHFYLLFNDATIHVQSSLQGEADATISGSPLSLLRMKLTGSQQKMLFSGDVIITGDMELGRQVNALLDEMDIDWEEHLSHIVGDVLAHELGSRTREFGSWLRQAMDTVTQNGNEYLHEELRLLISRVELDPFLLEIDILRNDAARLEKRIERLENQLSEKNRGQTS